VSSRKNKQVTRLDNGQKKRLGPGIGLGEKIGLGKRAIEIKKEW